MVLVYGITGSQFRRRAVCCWYWLSAALSNRRRIMEYHSSLQLWFLCSSALSTADAQMSPIFYRLDRHWLLLGLLQSWISVILTHVWSIAWSTGSNFLWLMWLLMRLLERQLSGQRGSRRSDSVVSTVVWSTTITWVHQSMVTCGVIIFHRLLYCVVWCDGSVMYYVRCHGTVCCTEQGHSDMACAVLCNVSRCSLYGSAPRSTVLH